ncbi:hypothetical protein G6011_05222 [Alternaria panax]|uniref:Uncharacterized protein n=1 Tax=Alternaria panax TaxID=48097 RepID=A0AAD4FEC5_9PLEO|nr:hypothetical protein G6011_05222 [Alternaria panax]
MLRLRTSELTLVPDDVDETFRRLALRQPSRVRSNRPLGPPYQPGHPILRPGPRRLTRDAVTALECTPTLQPQQATATSADDDYLEHAYQQVTPSTEHAGSQESASPVIQRDVPSRIDSIQPPASPALSSASPVLSLPSPESLPPRRSLHLPFRFGRSRQPSTTQSQPDAVVSISRTPTRTPRGHARLDLTGASSIGDASNNSTLSPSGGSTESTSGLRGGAGDRMRDVRDTPHAPSPLHQMQRPSSPAQQKRSGDPTKSPITPRQGQPTLFLEGYWHHTPQGEEYRIRESTERRFRREPPEPRRVSGRPESVMRSFSSGSAPSLRTNRARPPSDPPFDDVFSTLPSVEPRARRNASSSTTSRGENYYSTSSDIFHTSGGSLQPEQTGSRPRHFSSDASGASAQFSYYGSLPPSRGASSSGPPLENDISRLQLDEAAASDKNHRLAYADPSSPRHSTLRPNSSDSSVLSLPDNAGSGPHGVSPLPSMPYTRNQGDPRLPDYTTQRPGYVVDATTAAMEGLESPLSPYSEHYRHQLQAAQARANPHIHQPCAEGAQARRTSHSRGQGNRSNHPRHLPGQSDGPSEDRTREFEQSSANMSIAGHHPSWNPVLHGRAGQGEQRFRENLPSVPTSSYDAAMRAGRVQAQRAAYERLYNPRMAMQVETSINSLRHSMPQPTISHDLSYRRPHFSGFRPEERSSSLFVMHQQRQPPQGHITHSLLPPRVPTRQTFHQQHNNQAPQRVPTQAYRPVPGARYLNPTHNNPLTAVALEQGSGTTSRRSHEPSIRVPTTTTARTHRRIPPEQRDQENDGDRSAMRREEEGVNARYGEEEQQRDRMDETPPRIGRVERRMLDRDVDMDMGDVVRDV